MHRATRVPSPQRPYLASESRLSRTETVKSARRPSKIVPARPPALPTTWSQSWPLLKMTLTHTGHLSTTQRASPTTACVIRGE